MRPFLVLIVFAFASGCSTTTIGDDLPKLLERFHSEFVEITPGIAPYPKTFERGSEHSPAEGPVAVVTLDKPFSIAKYEVPQNLYEAVMGENPSRWKGPRNSVEMMTWTEADEFCRKTTEALRSAKLITADEEIRLPSEAEWEYCCRAGTKTAYSFGESATSDDDAGNAATALSAYAWHTGNAAGNDPPVGALKPNPWGLYDMHGYLWELCSDGWSATHDGAPPDGSPRPVAASEMGRVIRGGSWKDRYPELRSASRKKLAVDGRDDAVGFRCVMAPID